MVCILYISCSHCHVSVDETQRRMWYVYYTSVVATVMSLWTRHREEVVCILYISCSHCRVCLCGRDTEKNVVCILHISCIHCHVSVDETQRRMWYVYYKSVVATVMSLWTRHREECGMYTIHQL